MNSWVESSKMAHGSSFSKNLSVSLQTAKLDFKLFLLKKSESSVVKLNCSLKIFLR